MSRLASWAHWTIWTALRMSNSTNHSGLGRIQRGSLAKSALGEYKFAPPPHLLHGVKVLIMHGAGFPLQTAFGALTGRGYHIKLE